MEAARSSETLLSLHNTTRHHNPDDINLNPVNFFDAMTNCIKPGQESDVVYPLSVSTTEVM
jgi:hypothetical protein